MAIGGRMMRHVEESRREDDLYRFTSCQQDDTHSYPGPDWTFLFPWFTSNPFVYRLRTKEFFSSVVFIGLEDFFMDVFDVRLDWNLGKI